MTHADEPDPTQQPDPTQPDPRKCTGTTRANKRCTRWAIAGTTVCRAHGGAAPQVRAKGAVRAAVMDWGLDRQPVDPGETLLRLVTVTWGWWRWLRERLDEAIEAAAAAEQPTELRTDREKAALSKIVGNPPAAPYGMPAAVGAIIGVSFVYDEVGNAHPSGEYVRQLVKLEAAERSRCADLAAKAVGAGLAERQVRLAEKQGELLATVVEGLLRDLGHDLKDPKVLGIAQRHLRAVSTWDAA